MEHTPAISVIIPTCNRTDLLPVALRSLVWQTFKDFEVVVVNDGEDDVTPVIDSFRDSLNISLVNHTVKRQGLSAARNSGLRAARGTHLAYLDDDDFFYENHLSVLYGAMGASEYKVLYTDALLGVQRLIDGKYETVLRYMPLSQDFSREKLATANITPVLSVMHKTECLRRTGTFAEYLYGHEDWDLWQRIARHYPFHHIAFPTSEFISREGGGSLSSKKKTMRESWLFTRRQGMLFGALSPVCELEACAAKAVRLDACAPRPCKVSVILPVGVSDALFQDAASTQALVDLCGQLGESTQLVLVGAGSVLRVLYKRLAGLLECPPLCLQNAADVGRVIACNQGASIADGEWLVFLEPGVEPREGWLDALLQTAEAGTCADPATGSTLNIGAVSGVIEAPQAGTFCGGRINGKGDLIFNRQNLEGAGKEIPVDCLSSLCLMVRRDVFHSMGGFDLAFAPGHYADADFCFRLKERGLASVVVPEARLFWNRQRAPLQQNPAGLVSRRTFWDKWIKTPFSLERFITGADWSMRPATAPLVWPSDGVMPASFDIAFPPNLLDEPDEK